MDVRRRHLSLRRQLAEEDQLHRLNVHKLGAGSGSGGLGVISLHCYSSTANTYPTSHYGDRKHQSRIACHQSQEGCHAQSFFGGGGGVR